MPRYKLTIEYDGFPFRGWQRQGQGVPSVQGAIEEAIYQFCKEQVTLEGAGRTDTGVHATGQVAHMDLSKFFPAFRIQAALNFYLRESGTAIVQVEEVGADFHARFSAKARVYRYMIVNRRAHSPLLEQRAWHVILPLDVAAMKSGAQAFVGHHDFSSFRSSHCQANSAMRTIDDFTITQDGEILTARIQSRAFLHNQVRIMMGTLQQVGHGTRTVDEIKQALLGGCRTFAGPTAPAHGLYLTEVRYE